MNLTEDLLPADSRIIVKGHDLQTLFSALQARQQGILFAGPEGVGKKRAALAIAQALLCPNRSPSSASDSAAPALSLKTPSEKASGATLTKKPPAGGAETSFLPACGRCLSCRQTKKGENSSVLLIEPESLQIKIKEAKAAPEFLSLQSEAPARIVIIDPADRLNPHAADSLLKIIEEPPRNSFFFLISSSAGGGLPATLLSRLWTVRFRPLAESVMRELEPEAEDWALKAAQGSLGRFRRIQNQSDQRRFALKFLGNILESKNPLVFPCPAPPAEEFSLGKAPIGKKAAARRAAGRPLSPPPASKKPDPGGIASLLPLKDKKTALFTVQCFQQILRDSRLFQLTAPPPGDLPTPPSAAARSLIIHADQEDLLQTLSRRFSKGKIDVLTEKTLQMERDLKRHADSLSLFESFALLIHSVPEGELLGAGRGGALF